MKIEEAVDCMTKQYLTRVLDSFTRNFGPLDEDEMREYITRNADELAKPAHVEKKLDLFDVPHSKRVLMQFVLEAILNHDDCASTERDLAEAVQGREAALVEEALSDEALKYADGPAVDILQTVLEVAFEDDEVSRDEYRLIRRLREKLALSRKQQRIIEARLGVFPSQDRQLHDHEAIRDAVKELERRGVLFFCNRAEGGPLIVLPQEIQDPVKQTLDVELRAGAREPRGFTAKVCLTASIRMTPARAQASTIRSTSATRRLSGFSQRTCLPASIAAIATV